jgi:hypothetical protein
MENRSVDLQKKLGIKPGQEAFTLYAPSGYALLLPQPIALESINDINQPIDWLQVFYVDKSLLEKEIDLIKKCLKTNAQLWISWPKKTSKVISNLSDNDVRQIGLDVGLVDVKVASIDDTWSALEFVYHLRDR